MPELQIGGLVSFTTIDFPGKLAAVVFLHGCPLRCAYCSNPHLIEPGAGEYDAEKVFDWIKSRAGKLEGIVFSGGEALMQGPVLIEYIKRVRDLGFAIGLHTNGFYPDILARAEPYIDWIGLDYKATRERYEQLVGVGVAYDLMIKSLEFWLNTDKDLEVRTTCDPRFVSPNDLVKIAQDCARRGVKKFAVQKYVPHFEDSAHGTTAVQRDVFFYDDMKDKINPLFDSVAWRE